MHRGICFERGSQLKMLFTLKNDEGEEVTEWGIGTICAFHSKRGVLIHTYIKPKYREWVSFNDERIAPLIYKHYTKA